MAARHLGELHGWRLSRRFDGHIQNHHRLLPAPTTETELDSSQRITMFHRAISLATLTAIVAGCSTTPVPVVRTMLTAPAPGTFDGDVAGQAAEYVFALVPDANPLAMGIALHAGDSLRLALPKAFKRNARVPISPDSDTNLVLTKGWSQGVIPFAGNYRVRYSAASNSMIVKALRDIAVNGMDAPGVKVIHLRGRSFENPMPGEYPTSVTHAASDGRVKTTWLGQLRVNNAAPAVRLAPCNLHLLPGANADFQSLTPGNVAARDLARFPRYTGGLLVQDTHRDERLDPNSDPVVGGIVGAAPQGAQGQLAFNLAGDGGAPALAGAVRVTPILLPREAYHFGDCSPFSSASATSRGNTDTAWN